jgi:4-amino-4-deoxy-L-arabinose transferase-like glycosyltransferase
MATRAVHPLFWLTLAAFLVIAGLYATLTPVWQAPDEPAHYNYVRTLAETGRLPVLIEGCYNQAYLSEIVSLRFPPHLSTIPLCYEYHQPPLFYLLAVPVFRLSQGSLLALRLLSVALGGLLLWLSYTLVRAVFPNRPVLSLGTTAFVAFVPMHTAMLAAVNNDALAEVLLTGLLLTLIRYLEQAPSPSRRTILTVGLVLGLGLITKTTIYIGVLLVAAAFWLRTRRLTRFLDHTVTAYGLALLLALPWYARNVVVYGGFDLLGLARHGAVVDGQLRTAERLQTTGWVAYLSDFARVTFNSFWGQFGWMAVPIDPRLYLALAVTSLLGVSGLAIWIVRQWQDARRLTQLQRRAIILFGLTIPVLGLGYLWYNSQFIQFQGRYFFAAIVPIGFFFTLGLGEIYNKRWANRAAGGLVLLTGWLAVRSIQAGDLNGWAILIGGAFVALLGIRRWLPDRANGWLVAACYVGLVALSATSPFLFVVPYLSP